MSNILYIYKNDIFIGTYNSQEVPEVGKDLPASMEPKLKSPQVVQRVDVEKDKFGPNKDLYRVVIL